MKQESKFGKATDAWFDYIAKHSKAWSSSPSMKTANEILKRVPNKRNLLAIIELLNTEDKASCIAMSRERLAVWSILQQANAILAGEFKGEFRYRYNTLSPYTGQCSATSEFFSLLRQALNYNV